MHPGGPHARDDVFVVTMKDVYDVQIANGDRLITLEAAVRAADASNRDEWAGVARSLSDHETRLRRVEHWMWSLPIASAALLVSVVARVVR